MNGHARAGAAILAAVVAFATGARPQELPQPDTALTTIESGAVRQRAILRRWTFGRLRDLDDRVSAVGRALRGPAGSAAGAPLAPGALEEIGGLLDDLHRELSDEATLRARSLRTSAARTLEGAGLAAVPTPLLPGGGGIVDRHQRSMQLILDRTMRRAVARCRTSGVSFGAVGKEIVVDATAPSAPETLITLPASAAPPAPPAPQLEFVAVAAMGPVGGDSEGHLFLSGIADPDGGDIVLRVLGPGGPVAIGPEGSDDPQARVLAPSAVVGRWRIAIPGSSSVGHLPQGVGLTLSATQGAVEVRRSIVIASGGAR
jgi:hypothetical protein